jgi:hypothetical protein
MAIPGIHIPIEEYITQSIQAGVKTDNYAPPLSKDVNATVEKWTGWNVHKNVVSKRRALGSTNQTCGGKVLTSGCGLV